MTILSLVNIDLLNTKFNQLHVYTTTLNNYHDGKYLEMFSMIKKLLLWEQSFQSYGIVNFIVSSMGLFLWVSFYGFCGIYVFSEMYPPTYMICCHYLRYVRIRAVPYQTDCIIWLLVTVPPSIRILPYFSAFWSWLRMKRWKIQTIDARGKQKI